MARVEPQNTIRIDSQYEMATLRLKFILRPDILRSGGSVSIKCIASIPPLYEETTERILYTREPYHHSVREGRISAQSCILPGNIM